MRYAADSCINDPDRCITIHVYIIEDITKARLLAGCVP